MKKLFTLATLALAALAANAQYLCTQQGTVLTYQRVAQLEDDKTDESTVTMTVLEVTTAPDGIVSVRVEEEAPIPGMPMAKNKEYSTSTFNPADTTTVIYIAGADESKAAIIEMIKNEAASAGQTLGESQLAELEKGISVKGELSIALNPNQAPGTKLPNKTLRMRLGPTNFTLNLWEGKIGEKETITTPAGTFECLKVTYTQKMNMAGNTQKFYVTDWYAEGVGCVRSINAEKDGKVLAKSELQSIKKPE